MDLTIPVAIGIAIFGIVVGLLSALFGIGGGVAMVPFMVLLLHRSPHLAEGTSLLVIIPTAIAGVMSGLLGVGGGIVMVPLLVAVAHLSQHEAHATSLAAVVLMAAVGAATFGAEGEVEVRLGALLAAGSLLGAPLGARIMANTAESHLKIAFGVFMVIVSGLLLWT